MSKNLGGCVPRPWLYRPPFDFRDLFGRKSAFGQQRHHLTQYLSCRVLYNHWERTARERSGLFVGGNNFDHIKAPQHSKFYTTFSRKCSFGEMIRFGFKELFLGLTLVAIGATMCAAPFRFPEWTAIHPLMTLAVFIASGAFLGAGVATPFKRVGLGAAIGPPVVVFGTALLMKLLGP